MFAVDTNVLVYAADIDSALAESHQPKAPAAAVR